jgi:hypothetical protein
MTVAEILEQAKALSPKERKELAKSLIDMMDADESATQTKTGAEIVAMLQEMAPIEFVDPHIDDPVAWVSAQRRKRQDKLKPYRDGDE